MTLDDLAREISAGLGYLIVRGQTVDRTTATSGPDMVVRISGGGLTVQPRWYGAPVRIHPADLIVLMLGHRLGLSVDMGMCERCKGLREVESANADGDAFGHLYNFVCPACQIDGAPTGRNLLSWMPAILAARMNDQRPQVGGMAYVDLDVREELATVADKMQTEGDPFGLVLAAWLADRCTACGGRGRATVVAEVPIPTMGGTALNQYFERRTCTSCCGHGLVLGAYLDAVATVVQRLGLTL